MPNRPEDSDLFPPHDPRRSSLGGGEFVDLFNAGGREFEPVEDDDEPVPAPIDTTESDEADQALTSAERQQGSNQPKQDDRSPRSASGRNEHRRDGRQSKDSGRPQHSRASRPEAAKSETVRQVDTPKAAPPAEKKTKSHWERFSAMLGIGGSKDGNEPAEQAIESKVESQGDAETPTREERPSNTARSSRPRHGNRNERSERQTPNARSRNDEQPRRGFPDSVDDLSEPVDEGSLDFEQSHVGHLADRLDEVAESRDDLLPVSDDVDDDSFVEFAIEELDPQSRESEKLGRDDTDQVAPRHARQGHDRGGRGERPRGGSSRGDGPRGERPRNAGPRGQGARNEGQRSEGQRSEGQRNEGQRNEGQRNDGQRNEGQRNEGQRNEGQRNESQRGERPRNAGSQADRPRNTGERGERPRSEGPRNERPRGDRPRAEGTRGERPRDEGTRNERPRDESNVESASDAVSDRDQGEAHVEPAARRPQHGTRRPDRGDGRSDRGERRPDRSTGRSGSKPPQRVDRPPVDENESQEDDFVDLGDAEEGDDQTEKRITSWSEAVGHIIDGNMKTRRPGRAPSNRPPRPPRTDGRRTN